MKNIKCLCHHPFRDKQPLAFFRWGTGIVFCLIIHSLSFGEIILDSRVVLAQTGGVPCIPPPYPPTRVFKLVEEIRQSEPRDLPRGVFAQREAFVFLEGNEIICLSSTSDGRGVLQVDDQLEFQVTHADGSIATWEYDFYDKLTGGITTTSSQEISRLFAPRLNGVRITLRDFFPHYYSAFPIWLIVWRGPTPTPTQTLTATITRVPTPTDVPTIISPPSPPPVTNTPVATPTAPLSVVVTPTPTPVPQGLGISYGLCAIILLPPVIIMAILLMRNWQARASEQRWKAQNRAWTATLDAGQVKLQEGKKDEARRLGERVLKEIDDASKSLEKKV